MKITIDRFENDCAICECSDGGFCRILLSDLPEGMSEGTVLVFKDGKYFRCDTEESVQRSRAEDKLAAILKKR